MMNWRVFEYRRFWRILEKNVLSFNAYEVADTLSNIGMMITFEMQCDRPNGRLIQRLNELTNQFAHLMTARIKK